MLTKKIKVTITLVAGLVILLAVLTACANPLSAEPVKENKTESGTLIEKFAERFGLDSDEVLKFVEELKQERKVKAEENFTERLDRLVKNGEITTLQKDSILQKFEEIKNFKEELKDMKVSEARAAIKEMKQELIEWAKENDIKIKYIFPKKRH